MWVLTSCGRWEKLPLKAPRQGQGCGHPQPSPLSLRAWVVPAGCGLSGSGVDNPYAEHPLCLLKASLDQVARNAPLAEDTQTKISVSIFCPASSTCKFKHAYPANQLPSVVFVGQNGRN